MKSKVFVEVPVYEPIMRLMLIAYDIITVGKLISSKIYLVKVIYIIVLREKNFKLKKIVESQVAVKIR